MEAARVFGIPTNIYIWYHILEDGKFRMNLNWVSVPKHLFPNHTGTYSEDTFHALYEGESVNRSQMDIKRKTCDIRTWGKRLFLNISSTNIDTCVPSLYQCVETRSIEVFDCCLSHFCTSVSTSSSSLKHFPP
jgi:hypothetical protein